MSAINCSTNDWLLSPRTKKNGCELIEKLRIKNAGLLLKLTQMHLNFALSSQQFDSLINYDDESLSPRKANISPVKKSYNANNNNKLDRTIISNADLTEEGICQLYQLIEYIGRESNICQEGIFRKSGSSIRQQELKYKINRGMKIHLDECRYNVHDCASVLKTFLSEMKEPLLNESHFKIHCQIGLMCNKSRPSSPSNGKLFEKRITIIQLLLLLLPHSIRNFLRDLLTLLNRVALNSDLNRMESRSLATLFAPHLMFPKGFSIADMAKDLTIVTDQLRFMIDHVDEIFQPPDVLVYDVSKELSEEHVTLVSHSTPGPSDTAEGVLNTVVAFCRREEEDADYTNKQLAELYAYVHKMPDTPQKQKLLKQFNRQNGGRGTPQKLEPVDGNKKVNNLKTLGDSIKKAGHNLLRGGVMRGSLKFNKTPAGDGTKAKVLAGNYSDRSEYSRDTPYDGMATPKRLPTDEHMDKQGSVLAEMLKADSHQLSPLGNSAKKIRRTNIVEARNRNPIIM